MTDLKTVPPGGMPEPPPADERMASLPEPPASAVREFKHFRRIAVMILLIAGVAMATSLIVAALALGGQHEATKRSGTNATAAAQANEKAETAGRNASVAVSAAQEANRRLAAAGKPTVQIPTVTVSPPPAPQVEGLTAEQEAAVRTILVSQLAAYQPTLTPAQVQQIAALAAATVPKPKDGHTPTAVELQPLVVAAQAAYCSGGKCDGKTGAPGTPGADGTPGQAGDRGPGPTDEQVQTAVVAGVAAYCGQESKPCQGERGLPGKDAEPAYSVTDTDCVGDGRDSYWKITLSNGDVQKVITALGPCRIGPESPPVVLQIK